MAPSTHPLTRMLKRNVLVLEGEAAGGNRVEIKGRLPRGQSSYQGKGKRQSALSCPYAQRLCEHQASWWLPTSQDKRPQTVTHPANTETWDFPGSRIVRKKKNV